MTKLINVRLSNKQNTLDQMFMTFVHVDGAEGYSSYFVCLF